MYLQKSNELDNSNQPITRTKRRWRSSVFNALLFWTVSAGVGIGTSEVFAQNGIIDKGDAVVAGFSGSQPPTNLDSIPENQTEIDETFITLDEASVKVFDVSGPGVVLDARVYPAPIRFEVPASEVGQVFGVALDDADNPNIYVTATSAYGLHIVSPDDDDDGRPERLLAGQDDAQWMDGMFGEAAGGSPGSVWRIDGISGEVTLFADIQYNGQANGGAGLGTITFDAKRRQFFVSDLDTGLIHRLDMDGNELSTFDHGEMGRGLAGLAVVPMDEANVADITSPEFSPEDPGTWGFAAPDRRVWALVTRGKRLFYSVWGQNQIWSISLRQDGEFGDDPRLELDLELGPQNYPISDIVFSGSGAMVLSQRGDHAPSYDFASFANGAENKVMRFWREKPDDPITPGRWKPVSEEYAIGFAEQFDNANGGIDLGYGYDEDGQIDYAKCQNLLWASGDALRDNPNYVDFLSNGGELILNGLQASPFSQPKPQNTPPYASVYIDYGANLYDIFAQGSVGDVDVFKTGCAKPDLPPTITEQPDLEIEKEADTAICEPGGECSFTVTVRNVGLGDFIGSITFVDTPAVAGSTLVDWQPSPPWDCFDQGGSFLCSHPPLVLTPGDEVSVNLIFDVPFDVTERVYENCAEIQWVPEEDEIIDPDRVIDSADEISELQQLLTDLGYDPGPVDGAYGNKTKDAVAGYQIDSGLLGTGVATAGLLEALRKEVDDLNGPDEDISDDPVGAFKPENDRDCAEADIPEDEPLHNQQISSIHKQVVSSWHVPTKSSVHNPRVSRVHRKNKSSWHVKKTTKVHKPSISRGHNKLMSTFHTKYKSSWHVKRKSAVHFPRLSRVHRKYQSAWHIKNTTRVHNPTISDGNSHNLIISSLHKKYKSAWHIKGKSTAHNPVISRLHLTRKSSLHVKGKSTVHRNAVSSIHRKYKSAWHKSKTSRVHNPIVSDGNGHNLIISSLHKKYKSAWHIKGKSIVHNPIISRLHLTKKSSLHKKGKSTVHNNALSTIHRKYNSVSHKSKTSKVHISSISNGSQHNLLVSAFHRKNKSSSHVKKKSTAHFKAQSRGHKKAVSEAHKKYKSSWHTSKTSKIHNPRVSKGEVHDKTRSPIRHNVARSLAHKKHKSSWHNRKTTKIHNPVLSNGHIKTISQVHKKFKSSWHNRKNSKVHNPAKSSTNIHTVIKSGLQVHSKARSDKPKHSKTISNISIQPTTPKIFVPKVITPSQPLIQLNQPKLFVPKGTFQ